MAYEHELEKDGKPRWKASVSKDKGLVITDLASDQEFTASAYTHSGGEVRFALPGDNGLRVIEGSSPSYKSLSAAIDKINKAGDETPEPVKSTAKA